MIILCIESLLRLLLYQSGNKELQQMLQLQRPPKILCNRQEMTV